MAYSLLTSVLRRPVACVTMVAAGSVCATLGVTHGAWWWAAAGAGMAAYGAWMTLRAGRKLTDKLEMTVEAVDNNDFSLRFGGRWLSAEERAFNAALARLSDILRREKVSLAQQELYYSVLVNTVRTGIVAVTADGFVQQVNAEALKILGLNVLTHMRQLAAILPGLGEELMAMADGESRHVAFTRAGQEAQLLVRASSAQLRQKDLRLFAFDDIRSALDAKELESWMRLTRVLTHEIMNAMAPMISLSDTLLRSGELSARTRDGLTAIHSSASGLMSFVEAFRRFTALPKPAPRLVSVAEMLADVRTLAESEPGPEVRVTVRPADLMLYADPALIRQVLTNVIKNARQAITQSGEGSQVAVDAFTAGDTVTIEVANDGPAITDDVAEQIFVPFFTTKANGSGIGLSVSRQIMRLSNGNITLRRSTTGRMKTTFVITFD